MALSAVSSLRQNLLEVSEILHRKTSAPILLCTHIKICMSTSSTLSSACYLYTVCMGVKWPLGHTLGLAPCWKSGWGLIAHTRWRVGTASVCKHTNIYMKLSAWWNLLNSKMPFSMNWKVLVSCLCVSETTETLSHDIVTRKWIRIVSKSVKRTVTQ